MTSPTIAIIAPGAMGAAVGARMVMRGARVLTSLAGRSAASAARAETAGLIDARDEEICAADFILSIVPPKDAVALVERLAPALSGVTRKPLYIDCNAISPETVGRVEASIAASGTAFVDAGIIGGPPHPVDGAGPRFYASGPHAHRLEALKPYGFDARTMGGKIGDASALKMVYAGINKGVIGLGAAMVLAAQRAGIADTLHGELQESQRSLLASLSRAVPDMFGKAYRWAPEMQEIAQFAGQPAEAAIFAGLAEFYRRIAADHENGYSGELDALAGFFESAVLAKAG